MKNYTLFTAVVPFARTDEQPKPITVAVPNNATPLQTEYTPTGQVFHFLVPCDENGVPVEEVITPIIYEEAWNKLYELFGEQSNQEALDMMDGTLCGTKTLALDEKDRRSGQEE